MRYIIALLRHDGLSRRRVQRRILRLCLRLSCGGERVGGSGSCDLVGHVCGIGEGWIGRDGVG
jgi:hypothetical protein